MGNETEIKRRGIVIAHGCLIIRIVFIHQPDFFNGIFCLIQLPENGKDILCNGFIYHKFSLFCLTVKPHVEHMKIAEIFPRYGTVCLV